ncbi:hypothetical protein evm_004943 [Chilo suppressalis]|nr:hypothetical protein evm_004943 [Chilo suppressalis]
MLQTEDIDDDYFTPASSTSLANIFGKSQQKVTQCIFACALVGYEWSNKAYTTRGKLGFAILNILKTGIHNIILYDSKKVTLSNATISTTFEVTVKEKRYFSYLDNLQKYWSLYVSEEELNKILGLLKNFNVTIKYSSESKTGPDEIKSLEQTGVISEQDVNDEKESDTDSSLNRKTKISLLSRMAHMGQSVLPPRVTPIDKSSDSSDASDNNHSKASRHKPIKTVVKRNSSEKGVTECHSLVEAQNLMPKKEHSTESMPLFTYINGQLVPVTNTNIITSSGVSSGNDMNYIISEQRMNNSELRININRISDKLDKILSNVPNVESGDKNSNTNKFQVEILQKLISEYENKIRVYEEFIRFNKSEDGSINVTKLLPNSELQPSEQLKETCLIKD